MDWNAKLFLKINSLVGRDRWIDAFGRAGAEWVIVSMAGWFILTVWMARSPDKRAIFSDLMIFAGAWAIGLLLNWLIGLIVRKPRPHVVFPETKLLFQPLSSWKTFPSDHALAAFLFFFMALMFALPGAWGLLVLALWVGWGRVYAGLHYVFDIVGGALLAGLTTVITYLLLLKFWI